MNHKIKSQAEADKKRTARKFGFMSMFAALFARGVTIPTTRVANRLCACGCGRYSISSPIYQLACGVRLKRQQIV